VFRRHDFGYLGLIGSKTKRRRFEKQLRNRGISEHQLARLTCPIGVPGITGKRPADIAIAVAAQVLGLRDQAIAADESRAARGAA
jgi:xanthine dehydrogenase accessory factor